ncbi:low affinity immunoglobulin gamma Fc region receptor III-A-like [Leuresthes tenuis]|uniref:low affinity immunoglobulin gamma Fc region receptor III-A-like n=1 Tax=Leuresthes tenuis TaxID=355514 RepID=UPI003B50E1D0
MWVMITLLLLVAEEHGKEADDSVILESPVLPVMVGESVTLLCKNKLISTNLTADFYKDNVLIGSSNTGAMIINNVSQSDAGRYKCRVSGAGESPGNWLFVKAGVILECPAHPVKGGDSVTLRCRKHNDPTTRIADFYRHGVHINTGYNGEMIIHSASKSDEGPYKCSISGFGESAESWLAVKDDSVILESPVLPVMVGESVTLHCRSHQTTSSNLSVDFYKNNVLIRSSNTGAMVINNVSQSDAGRYKCRVSGAGESPENWLLVKEYPKELIPLCSDQILLYFIFKAPATILCSALMFYVLRKWEFGK